MKADDNLSAHTRTPDRVMPFSKRDYRGFSNLSSNELFHEGLPALYERFFSQRSVIESASTYPFLAEATNDLAKRLARVGDDVALAPGADPAIRSLVPLLSGTGRLILAEPSYNAFRESANACGMDVISVPGAGEGSEAFVHSLVQTIRQHGPALIALVDPNGITGAVLGDRQRQEIASAATQHGCMLLFDEAYMAFAGRAPLDYPATLPALHLRTLSKSHGAAGLRLALLIGPEPIVAAYRDLRLPNAVTATAVQLLHFYSDNRDAFARIATDVATRRDAFQNQLASRKPSWKIPESNGNFVFFRTGSQTQALRLAKALESSRIVVRTFEEANGYPDGLRITIGSEKTMSDVMSILTE